MNHILLQVKKEAPIIKKNSKVKYQLTRPIRTYALSNIVEVIVQTRTSVVPLIFKYKLAGEKYKAREVFYQVACI